MTAKIAAGCLKRTPPTMAEERRAFNSCLKEAQKLVKNVFVQLSGGAFCAARGSLSFYNVVIAGIIMPDQFVYRNTIKIGKPHAKVDIGNHLIGFLTADIFLVDACTFCQFALG